MTAGLITHPYHLARSDGQAMWHLGALLTFKAASETTGGRLWAKEMLAERGMATPVHRHTREDEAFYVLDGEISVHIGDDVVQAGAGDFLWGPRDVSHAFCVESARARLLVVSTPAGFERFFFDTGVPAAALTVPPPSEGPQISTPSWPRSRSTAWTSWDHPRRPSRRERIGQRLGTGLYQAAPRASGQENCRCGVGRVRPRRVGRGRSPHAAGAWERIPPGPMVDLVGRREQLFDEGDDHSPLRRRVGELVQPIQQPVGRRPAVQGQRGLDAGRDSGFVRE